MFVLIVLIIEGPVALLTFLLQSTQVVAVGELGDLFVKDVNTYNTLSAWLTFVNIGTSLWAFGAILLVATSEYIDDPTSVGDALRGGIRRILPYTALAMLFGAATLIGLFAVLVGAIFLGISLGLAFPAFWAERIGPIAALGRSWRLVEGRRLAVLGVAFTTTVLSIVFYFILGLVIFASLVGGTTNTFVTVLSLAALPLFLELVLVPLHPVMMTAVYYDSRVRHEAFDVELAARWLPDDDPQPPPLIR